MRLFRAPQQFNSKLPTGILIGLNRFFASINQKNKSAIIDIAESLEAKEALDKILTIPAVQEIISSIFQKFNKLPKVIGLDEDQAVKKCPFGAHWEGKYSYSIGNGHIYDMREPMIYFNRHYPPPLQQYLILLELINLTHAREYIQNDVDFALKKLSEKDLVDAHDKIENTVPEAAASILNAAKESGIYCDDISDYSFVVIKEFQKRNPRSDFLKEHAKALVSNTTANTAAFRSCMPTTSDFLAPGCK